MSTDISQAHLLNEPPPWQMLQGHRSKVQADPEPIHPEPREITPVTAGPHGVAIICDPGTPGGSLEPGRRMSRMKD